VVVAHYAALTPCSGSLHHFLSPIRPENCSSGTPSHPCLALPSRQGSSPRSDQFYHLTSVLIATRCLTDNDDDGETAAGGRLAHLLQILVWHPMLSLGIDIVIFSQDVNNVLIVVTRYFGGTLLGTDRFKHINQAARNALDAGGFLDAPVPDNKRSRKHK
jgi:hypothetical protein